MTTSVKRHLKLLQSVFRMYPRNVTEEKGKTYRV